MGDRDGTAELRQRLAEMMGAVKAYSIKEFTELAKSGGLAKPISEKPYTAREKGQPHTEAVAACMHCG